MIPGLNETHDIASETEIDSILVDMPLSMMKDLIQKQIEEIETSSKVNYMEVILDKFAALQEQYEDDFDTQQEIKSLIVEFYSFVIDKVSEKFQFSVNVDTSSVKETQDIGTVLYYFFILRYTKNMRRFMYKYINKNKKKIAAEFDPGEKKKDVTTFRIKKMVVKGKDDILIISELNTIVRTILDTYDFTNEEFISMACPASSFERWVMGNLIEGDILSDNFVRSYFNIVMEDDSTIDDIQNHVQSKMVTNNSK